VALEDVSVQELSIILEKLSFFSLIEPFQKNAVSGKTIGRMKSQQVVVDIGKGQINEVVAETFYEDFVVGWKQAGRIPRELLQPTLAPTITSTVRTVPLSFKDNSSCPNKPPG
jgi:hypothetical protein